MKFGIFPGKLSSSQGILIIEFYADEIYNSDSDSDSHSYDVVTILTILILPVLRKHKSNQLTCAICYDSFELKKPEGCHGYGSKANNLVSHDSLS